MDTIEKPHDLDGFIDKMETSDYCDLLESLGISDDDVFRMMESNMYFDSDKNNKNLYISESSIHGKGLFARVDLDIGSQWIASFNDCKYPCGRIINHSPNPNCEFVFDDKLVSCVVIKPIGKDCELLVNYRDHIDIDMIDDYKRSKEITTFDSKVPSLSDWDTSSPVDRIEYELSTMPAAELPLTHIFTDGIYVRKAFAPAGSMFTTVHHNTEHPFILISGTTEVVSNEGSSSITGPFMGITNKGTRRVVYAVTDAVYLTIHANPENLTDPDEIIRRITIPVQNPLMDNDDPRFNTWKKNVSKSQIVLTNHTN